MALFDNLYILEGHTPVKTRDITEWGLHLEISKRRVASDYINGVQVSTVFLGYDTNYYWPEKTEPALFETMVFGGELEGYTWRCSTWEQAEEQHKRAVEDVRRTFIRSTGTDNHV